MQGAGESSADLVQDIASRASSFLPRHTLSRLGKPPCQVPTLFFRYVFVLGRPMECSCEGRERGEACVRLFVNVCCKLR